MSHILASMTLGRQLLVTTSWSMAPFLRFLVPNELVDYNHGIHFLFLSRRVAPTILGMSNIRKITILGHQLSVTTILGRQLSVNDPRSLIVGNDDPRSSIVGNEFLLPFCISGSS